MRVIFITKLVQTHALTLLHSYLYINLRRSRDCRWLFVDLWLCGCASFTYFGQLLCCPHKRIVTITKVHIARNNKQVESIRFRKNYRLYWHLKLWSGNILSRPTCSLLSVTRRHWSIARRVRRTFRNIVTSGHVISRQARFRSVTSTISALIRYYLLCLTLSSSTCDREWTNG